MDDTPYNYCKTLPPVLEKQVRVKIGSGWRARVREIMGGANGCTHLTELLGPIATTAFQTLVSINSAAEPSEQPQPRSKYVRHLINSCHSHAVDSPLVQHNRPELFQPKPGNIA